MSSRAPTMLQQFPLVLHPAKVTTLGSCASRGLVEHVQDSLEPQNAQYILNCALASIHENLRSHVTIADHPQFVGCFDIASLSLAYGAIPDSVDERHLGLPKAYQYSPWQILLKVLMLHVEKLEMAAENEHHAYLVSPESMHPSLGRFLQLIDEMLEAGASPNARIDFVSVVVWDDGVTSSEQRLSFDMSVLAYIQYIGTNKYPECRQTAQHIADRGGDIHVSIIDTSDLQMNRIDLTNEMAKAITNTNMDPSFPYVPPVEDVTRLFDSLRTLAAQHRRRAQRQARVERQIADRSNDAVMRGEATQVFRGR